MSELFRPSFVDLHRQIDELFDELIYRRWPKGMAAKWRPLVDVHDFPDVYVVEVDLPGVAAEDISLLANEHSLTISGQRRPATAQGSMYDCCERPCGPFQRVVEFTHAVDPKEAQAELRHGCCSVRLPKKQARTQTLQREETRYVVRVTTHELR